MAALERYMTPVNACVYTGMNRKMLDALTRAGEIPVVRISERKKVYDKVALDQWMAERSTPAVA
jgi:predicted site-specific integrase-resolvase